MNITRYLIIPLKEGKIFDEECNEAIRLIPYEHQAKKHIENVISKNFPDWVLKPIETDFSYSSR